MLARTLGRTLDELGQTMTVAEFADHWGDYLRSPWGEQRDGMHAALIAQTVANYAGKMRKEPSRISDFILDFSRESEPEAEPDPAAFFNQFMK